LLLDLQMDRWTMDDIPSLTQKTAVIVLTASESIANAMTTLRLAARALVQKRFAIETLMTAIQAVHAGNVCADQPFSQGGKRSNIKPSRYVGDCISKRSLEPNSMAHSSLIYRRTLSQLF
jgi:DNA-binding NarL/FixJ family response regulator